MSLFYSENWTEIMTFISCDLETNVKKHMINFCLVQDLKFIEMNKKKCFDNLISLKFNSDKVFNNAIMSLEDLGFLYSLKAISYLDRT